MFPRRRRQQYPEHRFWVELITAESDASRFVQYVGLLVPPTHNAARRRAHTGALEGDPYRRNGTGGCSWTTLRPGRHYCQHSGGTACLPACRCFPRAAKGRYRRTACDPATRRSLRHADAVVVGEAELVWGSLLEDFERDRLKSHYQSKDFPSLVNMPAPRWDLIKGRVYGKGVSIATRGCPFACDYCTIPRCIGVACATGRSRK